MDQTRIYTAAVIIIGNEILSGRTQDVNINFLAKGLGEIGGVPERYPGALDPAQRAGVALRLLARQRAKSIAFL